MLRGGVVLVAAIAAAAAWNYYNSKADPPEYLFGAVQRGDIVLEVAASGTLEAVTTVQVGTQISGTIAELYADFNDRVEKGRLLARLDDSLLRTQLEQQQANVATAEANLNDDRAALASGKANIEKCRVDVLDKERKLKKTEELYRDSLVPSDDLETAQAALDASVAAQRAVEAQQLSLEARLKADEARRNQSQAALRQAEVNLERTIIRSPISGTVVSRDVDLGQTVAASLSAPTLFTIAGDLSKMQVHTSIDEADVGKIRAGMSANFTVDAYPGQVFHATVSQVRLAPTVVQNVVTYSAILDVANPEMKLKPGMTAGVKILIDKAADALLIPNAALRYRPAPATEKKAAVSGAARSAATEEHGNQAVIAARNPGKSHATPVWMLDSEGSLRRVDLTLGLSDGVHTQVVEGALQEGDQVIVGSLAASGQAAATVRLPGLGTPPVSARRFMR